jgi:hypothetical protein
LYFSHAWPSSFGMMQGMILEEGQNPVVHWKEKKKEKK